MHLPYIVLVLLVTVSVRQQSQVAGALDSGSQLTLITCFSTSDTARNDLASFSDVAFQSFDVFIIDLIYTFSGETAELATTEKNVPWIYSPKVSK